MVMRGCTCCQNKYTRYTWFGRHSRAALHHGGPGEAGQLPLQRPAGLRGHVPTVSQGAQPRKVPPTDRVEALDHFQDSITETLQSIVTTLKRLKPIGK